DRRNRPLRCADMAPVRGTTRTPRDSVISGLNGTAWALAVYASSGGLPAPGRKTRFWLLAKLYQAGFPPAGFHRKVSAVLKTLRPTLPSFSWRNLRPLFSSLAHWLRKKES